MDLASLLLQVGSEPGCTGVVDLFHQAASKISGVKNAVPLVCLSL